MFTIILLSLLGTIGIVQTIRALRTDGYHRTPVDPTRLP